MKKVIICAVLIGLSLEIVTVASGNIESDIAPNCTLESWKLVHEFNSCGSGKFFNEFNSCTSCNSTVLNIIDRINEYRNHSLNKAAFSQSITEYCATAKTVATCNLGKVLNIYTPCLNNYKIELLVNLLRMFSSIEADFCTEEIIYDITSDRGFECLENNYRFSNCQSERPDLDGTGSYFDNTHICSNMQYLQECALQIFQECEHDGKIKKYFGQAWNGLREEFSCIDQ